MNIAAMIFFGDAVASSVIQPGGYVSWNLFSITTRGSHHSSDRAKLKSQVSDALQLENGCRGTVTALAGIINIPFIIENTI
jgi:hypothetical protein